MYKPIQLPQTSNIQPQEYRLSDLWGGLVIDDNEQKIKDNQSPNMLNMWYMDKLLCKRPGQKYFTSALGSFAILAAYERRYNGFYVFAASTKLYKCNPSTGEVTQIHTGLTANKGSFFIYNAVLYYINGSQYIKISSTFTVSAITPYIPVVTLGRAPSGGGTTNEPYNRIGAGFTDSFSGTVGDTVYQLSQIGLDATLVTATVDGVAKVETTDFTVDRATGKVTFSVAPGEGINNVLITAYKTDATYVNSIFKNKYVEFFGANENYLFMCGNPDNPNTYYWSELLTITGQPNYFPDTNYNLLGSSDDPMSGFGKQYGVLILFKQRSVYRALYEATATNKFPVKSVNTRIGCDMPHSIQLVNNNLVWCNTYAGAYMLVSTIVDDERNVQPLSKNINGTATREGLLNETNLTTATSIIYKGHYILNVNNRVYAWNYQQTPYVNTGNNETDQTNLGWFLWDNITANCWFVDGQDLYYGHATNGRIVKFFYTKTDFDLGLSVYWEPKLNDCGAPEWMKSFNLIWTTLFTRGNTTAVISFYSEDGLADSDNITVENNSFSWDTVTWDNFTWFVKVGPETKKSKPKLKSKASFKPRYTNNIIGQDLAISAIKVRFLPLKEIK